MIRWIPFVLAVAACGPGTEPEKATVSAKCSDDHETYWSPSSTVTAMPAEADTSCYEMEIFSQGGGQAGAAFSHIEPEVEIDPAGREPLTVTWRMAALANDVQIAEQAFEIWNEGESPFVQSDKLIVRSRTAQNVLFRATVEFRSEDGTVTEEYAEAAAFIRP